MTREEFRDHVKERGWVIALIHGTQTFPYPLTSDTPHTFKWDVHNDNFYVETDTKRHVEILPHIKEFTIYEYA